MRDLPFDVNYCATMAYFQNVILQKSKYFSFFFVFGTEVPHE